MRKSVLWLTAFVFSVTPCVVGEVSLERADQSLRERFALSQDLEYEVYAIVAVVEEPSARELAERREMIENRVESIISSRGLSRESQEFDDLFQRNWEHYLDRRTKNVRKYHIVSTRDYYLCAYGPVDDAVIGELNNTPFIQAPYQDNEALMNAYVFDRTQNTYYEIDRFPTTRVIQYSNRVARKVVEIERTLFPESYVVGPLLMLLSDSDEDLLEPIAFLPPEIEFRDGVSVFNMRNDFPNSDMIVAFDEEDERDGGTNPQIVEAVGLHNGELSTRSVWSDYSISYQDQHFLPRSKFHEVYLPNGQPRLVDVYIKSATFGEALDKPSAVLDIVSSMINDRYSYYISTDPSGIDLQSVSRDTIFFNQ